MRNRLIHIVKKTRIMILFLLLLITVNSSFAQVNNLVPNSDFEYYTGCPDGMTQIDSAYPWTQPMGQSTSDYYNTCSNGWGTGFYSLYKPLSGNGFAGIAPIGYLDVNGAIVELREYISNKLKSKLILNNKYCTKIHVKRFGSCWYIIDSFGILFSNNFVIQQNVNTPLIYNAQVTNKRNKMLNDTLNWMVISDNFTANGGEQYITLGSFNLFDSIKIIKSSCIQYYQSYYFIDDVSVCDCDDFKPKLNKDTTLCIGQQLLLKANVPKEADSVIYTWQDGSKDSTYLVTQPGIYWVSAYIEDYKITVTDSIRVNYTDCTPPPIWIPNSFTPNGDGLNDVFRIETLDVLLEYSMLIFNRWGQLIYESNEVTKGWDGKYKGKQVESGVYTYRIEALDRIEKIKKVYNGKVTVVR